MSASRRPVDLPGVTLSESRGIRYLHLDTPWIQGAMRIDDPLAIELEYVQRMMAWMLFRELDELVAARAVQLGLGAAAITRFCLALGMPTTVVELNPQVVAACRTWFRLPHEGPGFEVLTMDAGDFVADPERRGSADVLAVDLYDHEAASPVLDSLDFYRGCHGLLADGGIMTVNLFGRDASFDRSLERIAAAFGAAAVHVFKPTREGNVVVLAMKHVTFPGLAELARRAETIQTRWQLPARKWLRMLRLKLEPDPAPLPDLPPA
jgi:spermidine synthase